jgi:hypothetical protein
VSVIELNLFISLSYIATVLLIQLAESGTLVSSTNKTSHHDITEILLKVALNTISQTNPTHRCLLHHWFIFSYPELYRDRRVGSYRVKGRYIIVMVCVDALLGIPTPKLSVPTELKVGTSL